MEIGIKVKTVFNHLRLNFSINILTLTVKSITFIFTNFSSNGSLTFAVIFDIIESCREVKLLM